MKLSQLWLKALYAITKNISKCIEFYLNNLLSMKKLRLHLNISGADVIFFFLLQIYIKLNVIHKKAILLSICSYSYISGGNICHVKWRKFMSKMISWTLVLLSVSSIHSPIHSTKTYCTLLILSNFWRSRPHCDDIDK